MTDTVTVAREMEGWALEMLRKSNAVALEAMTVLADAIQPVTSVIPSVTPPLAYDFAEQFMASERKFAEDMLHLTERLTPPSVTQAA
jgi:hypothetical protein